MKNLKIINHKYLLRGHTHLKIDSDYSIIERAKKKYRTFNYNDTMELATIY